MVTLSLKQHINSQPDQVFALFTDLEHAAGHISGIKQLEILSEGPVGVGTRFRETRIMLKKEATEVMEITAFEPPLSYTVEAESCGSKYTSTFRFAPNDAGTDVYFEFKAKPATFFAKLMSPLFILMTGPMKKCMQADLDDLRDEAERRRFAEEQAELSDD